MWKDKQKVFGAHNMTNKQKETLTQGIPMLCSKLPYKLWAYIKEFQEFCELLVYTCVETNKVTQEGNVHFLILSYFKTHL